MAHGSHQVHLVGELLQSNVGLPAHHIKGNLQRNSGKIRGNSASGVLKSRQTSVQIRVRYFSCSNSPAPCQGIIWLGHSRPGNESRGADAVASNLPVFGNGFWRVSKSFHTRLSNFRGDMRWNLSRTLIAMEPMQTIWMLPELPQRKRRDRPEICRFISSRPALLETCVTHNYVEANTIPHILMIRLCWVVEPGSGATTWANTGA